MQNQKRCQWAEGDALLAAYHDTEWGVPIHDSSKLWETLVLDGFQAGLSWKTILHKRDAFRAGFKGFDPALVARFGHADIQRLMADPGIVRSEAKVKAAIGNAKAYLEMGKAGEDFSSFVWNLAGNKIKLASGTQRLTKTPESETMATELKKRGFKFVSPVIAYAWMQAVGMVNDHEHDCFRRNEVQKVVAVNVFEHRV